MIDDLADRPHLADLLLDQNFTVRLLSNVTPTCYRHDVGNFAGPPTHFWVPNMRSFKHSCQCARRCDGCVFFGGADPDNFTCLALQALMHSELAHLAVDIVDLDSQAIGSLSLI